MSEETISPNGEQRPPSRVAAVAGPAVAAPAAFGAAGFQVTGEPTLWLWNDLLNWVIGGGLPIMPLPVAGFFGGLIIAAGYGVYRLIKSRNRTG